MQAAKIVIYEIGLIEDPTVVETSYIFTGYKSQKQAQEAAQRLNQAQYRDTFPLWIAARSGEIKQVRGCMVCNLKKKPDYIIASGK